MQPSAEISGPTLVLLLVNAIIKPWLACIVDAYDLLAMYSLVYMVVFMIEGMMFATMKIGKCHYIFVILHSVVWPLILGIAPLTVICNVALIIVSV